MPVEALPFPRVGLFCEGTAAIGAELGFTAGVIAPFSILCLVGLTHVGKKALRSGEEWKSIKPTESDKPGPSDKWYSVFDDEPAP